MSTPRSLGSAPTPALFSSTTSGVGDAPLLPCLTPHRSHPNPFFNSPKMEIIDTPQTDRMLMKSFSLEDKARAMMESRVAQGLVSYSDFEPSRATHYHEAQRKEAEAFQGKSSTPTNTSFSATTPKAAISSASTRRQSMYSPLSGTGTTITTGPIASQFVVQMPTDEEINKHTGYSEAWVARVSYTNRLLRLRRTLVQLRTINDTEMTARTKIFIDQQKSHDVLVARYFRSFSESMRKIRQRHNRDTRNRIKMEDEVTVGKHSRTHLVQAPAPPQAKRPSTENYMRRKRGSIDVSDVPLDDGDDQEEAPAFNPKATIDEIISSNSMIFNPSFSTSGGWKGDGSGPRNSVKSQGRVQSLMGSSADSPISP